MLSTLIAPDIVEYLDTGKIGARSIAGDRIMFARPGPELEYSENEARPAPCPSPVPHRPQKVADTEGTNPVWAFL